MFSQRPVIAITSGEPAGVGPELCAALAQHEWPARIVVSTLPASEGAGRPDPAAS